MCIKNRTDEKIEHVGKSPPKKKSENKVKIKK